MTTLDCDSIGKSFGTAVVLDGVNVAFRSPGIVALIGPNGAGKTTLLNVITGVLQADRGKCALNGYNLIGRQAHEIAGMGIARTFQQLDLIRQVTVMDNVLFAFPSQLGETFLGAIFRIGVGNQEKTNKQLARDLLASVGLEKQAHDIAGELSYGQQKLLSIACCLAMQCDVLLLDEPVAGVHPDIATKIQARLVKARDEGKLVIFVEHDIAAVRAIADIVVVMDQGKVIAQGPPQDVLKRKEIMEVYLG